MSRFHCRKHPRGLLPADASAPTNVWPPAASASIAARTATPHRRSVRPLISIGLLVAWASWTPVCGQTDTADREADAAAVAEPAEPPELDPQAIEALRPLFDQVRSAQATRAIVQLSADTVIDGAVIGREESTYQIASTAPDAFTVYWKSAKTRSRLYVNSKQATVAFEPPAYVPLKESFPMQQAVFQLPVPMGPYPEVVLALTLAGVDPKLTLTTGVKSVTLVDRNKFRGQVPSIHLAGIQDDDVRWDLWITQEDAPKPLRLQVNLTEMLRANGDLELPPGYRYTLRFDFATWKLNHENNPALFRFTPDDDSKKYETIEAYYQSVVRSPAEAAEQSGAAE